MQKKNYDFYKTNLEIDVEKQFINVDMELSYYISEEKTKEISFLLHENLKIRNLEGEKIQGYSFANEKTNILPEARTLVIQLEDYAIKDENINIQFSYSGKLGILKPSGENRITKDWVALGLYFPWFPLNTNQLGKANITYDIDVKIDESYSVFGVGETQKKNGYWNISDNTPNIDMIVMASKELRKEQIQTKGMNLEMFYNQKNDVIEKYGVSMMNSFIEWFGENEEGNIKFVFAPGGSYGRKGLVVLREPEDMSNKKNFMDYITLLAHELSHLWWTNAPVNTWEEWFNESFAEYSALMIIREKFTQEDFDKIIEDKREKCLGTPPIKGLDMKYEKRKTVTYDKGCLILNHLETKVGEEEFINILKESYRQKVNSTERFLDILSEQVGEEISREIDEMLGTF